MSKFNQKICVDDGKGGWRLRIYHSKPTGKKSARLRIKCGCCDERVDIYHDSDSLEINGVHASLAEWKKILLPLLKGQKIV